MFETTLKNTISGNLAHVTCRKLPHLGCYTVFLHQGFLSNQTIHVHMWQILKMAKKAIYEILCTKLEAFNLIWSIHNCIDLWNYFLLREFYLGKYLNTFPCLETNRAQPIVCKERLKNIDLLKIHSLFFNLYWEKHLDCSFIPSNKYGKEI